MGIKIVKRLVFESCIIIPLLCYIQFIEGYELSKWEAFGIGFTLPILIRLIAWAKDGYKND
jgi:hypothetical protein